MQEEEVLPLRILSSKLLKVMSWFYNASESDDRPHQPLTISGSKGAILGKLSRNWNHADISFVYRFRLTHRLIV
jgi:hypothetical protein